MYTTLQTARTTAEGGTSSLRHEVLDADELAMISGGALPVLALWAISGAFVGLGGIAAGVVFGAMGAWSDAGSGDNTLFCPA